MLLARSKRRRRLWLPTKPGKVGFMRFGFHGPWAQEPSRQCLGVATLCARGFQVVAQSNSAPTLEILNFAIAAFLGLARASRHNHPVRRLTCGKSKGGRVRHHLHHLAMLRQQVVATAAKHVEHCTWMTSAVENG